MKLSLAGLSRFDYIGVLLLRLGAGALVAYHGFPALIGGKDAWVDLGSGASIVNLSSDFFAAAGLTSALIQVFGGIAIAIGLFTRAFALLLAIVASFALASLIARENFELAFFAHLHLVLVFFAIMFIGPGRLSLDRKGI